LNENLVDTGYSLPEFLGEVTDRLLVRVCAERQGDKTETARALGFSRR
jgi:hypothetical protein